MLSPPLHPFLNHFNTPLQSLSAHFSHGYFFIYTLPPTLLLGHIHLVIVMIAVRSSAMACRKSELVHVSEHRYALWTAAASFTTGWSGEGVVGEQNCWLLWGNNATSGNMASKADWVEKIKSLLKITKMRQTMFLFCNSEMLIMWKPVNQGEMS